MKPVKIHIKGGIELAAILKGNKIAISISKIKKTIAIKKNRIEKGRREVFLGSNPLSKGEAFSRSKVGFLEKRVDKIIRVELIIIAIKKLKISIVI